MVYLVTKGTTQPVSPTQEGTNCRPFLSMQIRFSKSCFHQSFSSDVTNFQNRREDTPDSPSAQTPSRNRQTVTAVEQKIQHNPAKTHPINQPNQAAAAPLAAGCSPSQSHPLVTSEVHSYGENLLASGFCLLNLDIKSLTPRLPPSNCFHNTRGRQDSHKVLRSETHTYQRQKTARNAHRAQRTQEKVGATSEHSPSRPFAKGNSRVFGVFHSRNSHKTDRIRSQALI